MSFLRVPVSSVTSCRCTFYGNCGGERYEDRHAADCGAPVSFRASIPRVAAVSSVSLRLFSDRNSALTVLPMEWIELQEDRDLFEILLDTTKPGLFFFSFEVMSFGQVFYSKKEEGNSFSFSESERSPTEGFQLLLSDFRYSAPEWIYGGVIYQIFVDRFSRGNNTPIPDGMVWNPDWESGELEYPDYPGAPMKNNMVYGGNLSGITDKLGYLSTLGVKLLYLSPVFESPSNHKYDTSDYLKIDPLFGEEADFRKLIEEAGKRGIRILLDGVFNHTGADSLYFNRYGHYRSLGAYQSKSSPYYNWYRFWDYPDRYECWWNIPILPRIHPEEPSCRAFIAGENGVVSHYAKMGIGGFRLDVSDELSDDFIRDIKETLHRESPDSVLYGEVWEDASNKIAYGKRKEYYQGLELDGVMNYPLRSALLELIRNGRTDLLRDYIRSIMPNMPKRILDAQMNLLGTHDTLRILTALAGESPDGKPNEELYRRRMSQAEFSLGIKRLKAAYLLLATMPGVPVIYYGDEAGMEGYSDPFNRLPFPWGKEKQDLLGWYRKVNAFRTGNEIFQRGSFRLLQLDDGIFAFARKEGKNCSITVYNGTSTTFQVQNKGNINNIIGGRRYKDSIQVSPCNAMAFVYESGSVRRLS